MADRLFTVLQRRPGFARGGADEVVVMGTGADHGDGTADVEPVYGKPALVDVADLTANQGHHGFTTRLVYDDEG